MPRTYSKEIKQKACNLRHKGWSLGEISLQMKIPKNTIIGWVKDIKLTKRQKERLKQKIIASGAIGRPLAVKVNREKLERWKRSIKEKVRNFEDLNFNNAEIGKLVCGVLYLCEGAKYPSTRRLELINSDPQVIHFFITSLRKYFRIYEDRLRISIVYRYDQDLENLINFWSNLTNIPKTQFLNSKPDMRTKGKKTTRKNYRGVCKIIYYCLSNSNYNQLERQ